MSKYSKPKVANNPLSKNIARILGYYDRSAAAFKVKIEDIAIKSKEKFPNQKGVSAQTILSWIMPKEGNLYKPVRFPLIDNLSMFADIHGISDPWGLYVDRDIWVKKNIIVEKFDKILPSRKEIITRSLQIEDYKFWLSVQQLVDVYEKEKERVQNIPSPGLNKINVDTDSENHSH